MVFFPEITRSFPHTVQVHAWWTVFTFYHEAEHPMSCLDNVVKIQSYPVGQSSFTEKVLIYEIKKIILEINGCMSFRLHCQFAILIMTMKTPEYFRTLWTERFSRNDLNGLYGTKRFENETERFGDGPKRFENDTNRFGNGTKRFWERNAVKV